MMPIDRRGSLAHTAAAAALALACAAGTAHAADSEPIALELHFDPGMTPCFTSADLASTVQARLGQSVSAAPLAAPAPLSVVVRVRAAAASGFDVVIESRARESGETGQRELRVEGGCENLAAPLSLVIALMVGTAQTPEPAPTGDAAPQQPLTAPSPSPASASAPASAPASPPAPAPAPPERAPAALPIAADAGGPNATGNSRTGLAMSIAGGADLGLLPEASALVSFAVRYDFVRLRRREGAHAALEVSAEFLSSPEIERSDFKTSIEGAGLHADLCAIWQRGWFSVEPCAGLWLRSLGAQAEGEASARFEPARFSLTGWSTRVAVRAQLAGPWSVFTALHALAPFGTTKIELVERDDFGDEPFFNVVGVPATPGSLYIHEVPIFALVLLAGVTFAP